MRTFVQGFANVRKAPRIRPAELRIRVGATHQEWPHEGEGQGQGTKISSRQGPLYPDCALACPHLLTVRPPRPPAPLPGYTVAVHRQPPSAAIGTDTVQRLREVNLITETITTVTPSDPDLRSNGLIYLEASAFRLPTAGPRRRKNEKKEKEKRMTITIIIISRSLSLLTRSCTATGRMRIIGLQAHLSAERIVVSTPLQLH